MELRSNIKMLNYARKYLLNDTDSILPFPVRPQKPPRTGRLPAPLPRSAPQDEGVPAAALDTLYRSLSGAECGTHACIVLRHGRVVSEGWYAPYSGKYWHVTHSMCKSVTAVFRWTSMCASCSPRNAACSPAAACAPSRCAILSP